MKNLQKSLIFTVAAGLVLSSALAFTQPNLASARRSRRSEENPLLNDFNFSDFSGNYTLKADEKGNTYLEVEENLTAVFRHTDVNHGIERAIPSKFNDRVVFDGKVKAYRNGSPEEISLDRSENGYAIYRIGSKDEYVNGVQRYTFKYNFYNVINVKDGQSQNFIWNVNGTAWKQSFAKVSAKVKIDSSAKQFLTGEYNCYFGGIGSTQKCANVKRGEDGDSAVFDFSQTSVSAGANITFDIGFKPGSFAQKTLSKSQIMGYIATGAAAFLGLLALILLLACWLTRRQIVKANGDNRAVVAQYLPPKIDDFDILDAGNLVGSPKKMTALILYLAVNGNLKIVEDEKKRLIGTKKVYVLQKITTNGLNLDLATAMDKLFSGSETLDLSEKISPAKGQEIQKVIENSAFAKTNFYLQSGEKKSLTTVGVLSIIVIPIAIVALGLTVATFVVNTLPNGLAFFAPAILAIILSVVSIIMAFSSIKSRRGSEAENYLKGLKLYISVAEKDRLAFNQNLQNSERFQGEFGGSTVKLYEKLLPWAALFGLENSWSKVLEAEFAKDDYRPDWYNGQTMFNAMLISSIIGDISTATTNYYSSSVSSGGGSGGGFSGGGGGGGGGGGW